MQYTRPRLNSQLICTETVCWRDCDVFQTYQGVVGVLCRIPRTVEGIAAHGQREHGITASVSCVACDARPYQAEGIIDSYSSVHCI